MSYSQTKKSWLFGVLSSPVVNILEGSLFLALLAKITLPLPFTPIPVTFQTLGIYCIGVACSPTIAVSSVIAYLLEGLFFPVFYSSEYGVATFFGPTAGYLYAFPLVALFISLLYRRFKNPNSYVLGSILAGAAFITLLLGSLWLACYFYMTSITDKVDLVLGLQLGAAPFVIGETLKILLIVQGRKALQFFEK
ncbi:Biotin ECF transporter S component BioY2,BioY family [Chlamydia poikilotherma]|uniref:Biotin transporter n=1 Tax=Chlamydia poikilotherma TaxID=1967783 RepID=A0A3B0QHA7_9CHLA|nr:biotin transporter BioY [Chlamydia poikilotherma]SYX09172.1 Biotin ECF transporter S component BioY2,BioY family [Chlamydia poikilotherma]